MSKNPSSNLPESKLSLVLFADTKFAFLWLIIRVYVGWQWLLAGWDKVQNPVWVGEKAGVALSGFLTGALSKTTGPHPDVLPFYAQFLSGFVMHNLVVFSYLVSFGELLVGVALILGAFTGVAAFFGAFMNMNYLLAGTVSINPVLFLFELFLILAWRIAGWLGLDRFLLPLLDTPWKAGKLFR
jgi:thiosulfate dehydrogenase [quinone] large subunit